MSFLTPVDEIGNQQQKENREIHKYIKLNKMVKEEVTREIRKYLEANENKIQYTKFTGFIKEVLERKFIAIHTYIKKERSQFNNLSLHHKEIKKEQTKPKRVEGRK